MHLRAQKPEAVTPEFSFQTRAEAIRRFETEMFDLFIIGGGITGAAVARDAASRGLKVALVEKNDFASGTSSRSSKLIHGGLRYLENLEFGLVFEALSERAFLLKSVPHMVRPLKFFLPVYQGDAHGKGILDLGLWLYDLLALFRTPGAHRRLSRRRLEKEIPFLRRDGLQGGFSYFDASMWDDVLAIETLRAAQQDGAAAANYVEAVAPVWTGDQISGFRLRDHESSRVFELKASRTIVCAGPWTDEVGPKLSEKSGKPWTPWLTPSKGVHLIFDLKRLPLPGALVMSHPADGRISFVIPRPDYGSGVVIVGTTDGPTPAKPENAEIESSDVSYLMELLNRYFPDLKLTTSDILSAYVGVRPLVGPGAAQELHAGDASGNAVPSLAKLSREHFIGDGPGGTVVVAGGKYTTHRTMAAEIVEHALKSWKSASARGVLSAPPENLTRSRIDRPINSAVTPEVLESYGKTLISRGLQVPKALLTRYGAAAQEVMDQAERMSTVNEDPDGFPALAAQLVHTMRTEMVVHLEDFYWRRQPLVLARADHGLPWAEELSQVWARERGYEGAEAAQAAAAELLRLRANIAHEMRFKRGL
jgi:glycerol-3-phosphate dehydrogenase